MDYKQIASNLRGSIRGDWCDKIEAADDLMAALEAAEGALASFIDGNPEPNLRAVDAICDLARAAIAKARGE